MAKKKPALPPYCGYYVWQWNISADYGTDGLLLRVYLNGEPVFPSGKQKKDPKEFKTGHQSIYKMKRLRPKASKGEKELSYLLFDADGDLITISDTPWKDPDVMLKNYVHVEDHGAFAEEAFGEPEAADEVFGVI